MRVSTSMNASMLTCGSCSPRTRITSTQAGSTVPRHPTSPEEPPESKMSVFQQTARSTCPRLSHPPRITRGDHHHRVMQEAIEEENRGRLHGQEVAPLFEWPVARYTQAAPFVRSGPESKQQLRTGVIERSKPQLIDQNQFMPQQPT